MTVSFNVTTLPTIAGAILSLLFSYIPGLEAWYANLSPIEKRVVMLVLILLTAVIIFVATCAGVIQSDVTCSQDGIVQAINIFFSVLVANQATFLLSAKSQKTTS